MLWLDPVYRIACGFLANACPLAIYCNHLSNVPWEAGVQALLDQEQRHLGVLQQEGQSLLGIAGIQWYVCSPSFEDGEQTYY